MDLTAGDIDILLVDFVIECCPVLNDCSRSWAEDRKIILVLAHKMISLNFYSTDPGMTINSEMYSKLGMNVALTTCKHIHEGWMRISKLRETIVDWSD